MLTPHNVHSFTKDAVSPETWWKKRIFFPHQRGDTSATDNGIKSIFKSAMQCFLSEVQSAHPTSLQNKSRCRPLATKPIIDKLTDQTVWNSQQEPSGDPGTRLVSSATFCLYFTKLVLKAKFLKTRSHENAGASQSHKRVHVLYRGTVRARACRPFH